MAELKAMWRFRVTGGLREVRLNNAVSSDDVQEKGVCGFNLNYDKYP